MRKCGDRIVSYWAIGLFHDDALAMVLVKVSAGGVFSGSGDLQSLARFARFGTDLSVTKPSSSNWK